MLRLLLLAILVYAIVFWLFLPAVLQLLASIRFAFAWMFPTF